MRTLKGHFPKLYALLGYDNATQSFSRLSSEERQDREVLSSDTSHEHDVCASPLESMRASSPTLRPPPFNSNVKDVNGVAQRVHDFQRAYEQRCSPTDINLRKGQPKTAIHIKLDKEIVAFFKKDGPGYQTRINSVLRKYVRSGKL